MNGTLVFSLTLGVLLAGGIHQSAQAQVGRANNTDPFNANSAWTGGVAPTLAQVAGFSSINTPTSAASTIGDGVNCSVPSCAVALANNFILGATGAVTGNRGGLLSWRGSS